MYFEILYLSARGWLFYKAVMLIQVTVWENESHTGALEPIDLALCETAVWWPRE